jgi:hypothetical protein
MGRLLSGIKKEMVTILYYTSNREDESFEKKIQENILKQTDLPIISVSQKPINFGKNILNYKSGIATQGGLV